MWRVQGLTLSWYDTHRHMQAQTCKLRNARARTHISYKACPNASNLYNLSRNAIAVVGAQWGYTQIAKTSIPKAAGRSLGTPSQSSAASGIGSMKSRCAKHQPQGAEQEQLLVNASMRCIVKWNSASIFSALSKQDFKDT
eukprot:2813447-Pleurochrysis_carterae.AAC.1